MAQVVITLRYGKNQRADLALPNDIRALVLAPAIAAALQLEPLPGQAYALAVMDEKQRRLNSGETLQDAGVMYGDTLELQATAERQQGEEPPLRATAWLKFENGEVFKLNPSTTLLGRWAPGVNVDVDLTPFDPKKQCSRQHAVIENRHGSYYLTDESANGTWLNGRKIPKSEGQVLKNSDVLNLSSAHSVRITFVLKVLERE
jgi:hypothetical protein